METPTKSPGCQTKKGRGIQFNMWKCVKTPAFLPLSPPPTPPVNYHLLSALLPEYLLNIQTYFHPYCNTAVQTTKISHGPQPLSWTSYSQYSQPLELKTMSASAFFHEYICSIEYSVSA